MLDILDCPSPKLLQIDRLLDANSVFTDTSGYGDKLKLIVELDLLIPPPANPGDTTAIKNRAILAFQIL